jgi:hypothetical protein
MLGVVIEIKAPLPMNDWRRPLALQCDNFKQSTITYSPLHITFMEKLNYSRLFT